LSGVAIHFAKRLAHQEKKVRDSSLKSLRRWLLRRETLDASDLMKIWKGLFYCFWMSDKVPVQQQLAESLSDLLLPPLSFERSLLLFETCLHTLYREWTAIDQLRMDKFMTLARRFVQKAFMTLQAGGWETSQVEALTDCILESNVLAPNTHTRGFAFHLMDVFLPELERVCSSSSSPSPLPFSAFSTLLTPFFHILARSSDKTMVDRCEKEVWNVVREVAATPVHVLEEELAPKSSKKSSKQPSQPPAQSRKKSKKVPQGGSKSQDEDVEMEDAEAEQAEEEEAEEDLPQAKGAASEYPMMHATLQDNADKIAEVMQAMATDE
jgi:ribosomal RNA-processing protein 1